MKATFQLEQVVFDWVYLILQLRYHPFQTILIVRLSLLPFSAGFSSLDSMDGIRYLVYNKMLLGMGLTQNNMKLVGMLGWIVELWEAAFEGIL